MQNLLYELKKKSRYKEIHKTGVSTFFFLIEFLSLVIKCGCASSICSSSMLMDELDVMGKLDFLLKIERMKVKDTGLVPVKDTLT